MKKIILNHKCYLKYEEIIKYKTEIEKMRKKKEYEIILMPSMIYLSLFKDSKVKIGAQNFFSYNGGAFTGETSLEALRSIGISTILLGHSERKEVVGETYALTRDKLFKSLNSKTETILCVGEHKARDNALKFIKKELDFLFKTIEEDNLDYLTLAYEPSWAIGGFESQSVKKIDYIITNIKKYVLKKYNKEIKVLYGGSVSEENIKDIIDVADGVLIGRRSTDISKVKELIKLLN